MHPDFVFTYRTNFSSHCPIPLQSVRSLHLAQLPKFCSRLRIQCYSYCFQAFPCPIVPCPLSFSNNASHNPRTKVVAAERDRGNHIPLKIESRIKKASAALNPCRKENRIYWKLKSARLFSYLGHSVKYEERGMGMYSSSQQDRVSVGVSSRTVSPNVVP